MAARSEHGTETLPPMSELILAYDELSKVRDGMSGMMDMIANRNGKVVRIKKDALYFAFEPHQKRMCDALQRFDQARRRLAGPD